MRPLPGLNAMVYRPATDRWEGEPVTSPARVRLFAEVDAAIRLDTHKSCTRAIQLLDKLSADAPKLDQVTSPGEILNSALPPSLEMRRLAAYGHVYMELDAYDKAHDYYDKAYDYYDMAQSIATERNDLPSQIELHRLCALMRYGTMRFYEALALYQEALDRWRDIVEQLAQPAVTRVEQEVTLRADVGKMLWNVGQFDDAQAILARTRTLTMHLRGERRTPYLRRQTADAVWTLMLVFRCQSDASDASDGDATLVGTAIKRAKTVDRLYQSVGTSQENLARFTIQVAELYLDLAEIYQLRGARGRARYNLTIGRNLVIDIAKTLESVNAGAAMHLVDVVAARHDILCYMAGASAASRQAITAQLASLQKRANASGARLLQAKVAVVLAEWLMLHG